MIFIDTKHRRFFEREKEEIGTDDREKLSLLYLIGLTETTREHAAEIYHDGMAEPDVLSKSWQTATTKKILILAFQLYGMKPKVSLNVLDIFAVGESLYPYLLQALHFRLGYKIRQDGSGRPKLYGEADALRVKKRHASGESIRTIALMEDMSTATVQKLLRR